MSAVEEPKNDDFVVEGHKIIRVFRPWGYYRVLHEAPGVKVKELYVEPKSKMSMQRHQYRHEFWFTEEGLATVRARGGKIVIPKQCCHIIAPMEWHQIQNNEHVPLKMIEIQFGTECDEDDIERADDSNSTN